MAAVEYLRGKVTQTTPLRVQIDGDNFAITVDARSGDYTPAVDDIVMLISYGPTQYAALCALVAA